MNYKEQSTLQVSYLMEILDVPGNTKLHYSIYWGDNFGF